MRVEISSIRFDGLLIIAKTDIEKQYLSKMRYAETSVNVESKSIKEVPQLLLSYKPSRRSGRCPDCGSDSVCGIGDSKESICNDCGTFWVSKKYRKHFEQYIRNNS